MICFNIFTKLSEKHLNNVIKWKYFHFIYESIIRSFQFHLHSALAISIRILSEYLAVTACIGTWDSQKIFTRNVNAFIAKISHPWKLTTAKIVSVHYAVKGNSLVLWIMTLIIMLSSRKRIFKQTHSYTVILLAHISTIWYRRRYWLVNNFVI